MEENQSKQQEQHLSKHERRELKKLKREEERNKIEENKKKKKSTKNIITYSIIAVIVLGFIYLIYFLVTRAPSGNNTGSDYDLSGIPSGDIHWHADVNVNICGENIELPDGLVGGHLGAGLSHTHDRATNKNSMPSSDGNGVMHLEGNVKANPSESTFVKYMKNIGINFNENEIMDKKNGDLCNDRNGTVNIYVNGKRYDKDLNYYIPRDNDFIDIKFE